MLYWHVQDYLPQHLNEKSQMQYITVLFLTMSIIKKKKSFKSRAKYIERT